MNHLLEWYFQIYDAIRLLTFNITINAVLWVGIACLSVWAVRKVYNWIKSK